ncbi:MAG: glycosyltransferase 61 family protein [Planctomycetia bacterium]
MPSRMADKTIIYDFGANVGGNLDYYLCKADLVVAVEANPSLCRAIEMQFAAEISAGRLVVENVVLVAERGPPSTPFFIHRHNHVLSQWPRPPASKLGEFTEVVLPTRHVLDVIGTYGPAHYIKIDIEHSDAVILRALLENHVRPDYISAEGHDADIFCLLVALGGYNAFKLVDGASVQDVFAALEIATRNGRKTHTFARHSAGPFGNDIPGPWHGKNTFLQVVGRVGLGWKDIHASLVDQPPRQRARPTACAASPSAADGGAPGPLPHHGILRGECLVLAEPLLFMTASGQPIIAPHIDRSANMRSAEQLRHESQAARSLPEIVHDEPSLILSCTWDAAFYHFLYDALGKLAVADCHGITPANHAVYFNTVAPWQRDALELLGVHPRPLPGGAVHRFRQGVIPSYSGIPPGWPTPEFMRFMRRLRSPDAEMVPGRKLFLSRRRGSSSRTLENEGDLYDRYFRARGYELVDPGTLSFADQRKLFSAATHLAGPHGAAFSLLCLGRLPLSVIELHSPHYHAACFRNATTALGGRYAAFNARQRLFQPPHWQANFTLDTGAVAAWLASLPPGMI